jgi:cobalt-zinc-cadmium efflux system membrane fusion protein
MALKYRWKIGCVAASLAVVLLGCGRSAPGPAPAAPEDADPLSVTRWTDKTELFAEYPALVVGHTSRFAIHLTQLEPFKAVQAGAVDVELRGTGDDIERFHANAPSRPGIFGVDVRPARAGKRELVIRLRAPGLTDEQRVGTVDVHATAEAAKAAAPADAATEAISFLKEQQWALDFGTVVVATRALRESIRIPAEIRPRPGGTADVVAPIDGRLAFVAGVGIGAAVNQGQELARVLPPAAAPGDLPALERARADAAAVHAMAIRDRERAERLVPAGAAPQRRLDDARTAETRAAAAVQAAEAQLTQYHRTRTAGDAAASAQFIVRAPIAGVIAARSATSGSNVSAGTSLFQLVNAALVDVVGQIPELHSAKARQVTSASLEVPGSQTLVPVGRMTALGKMLDPQARSLPIVFALDNRTLGLPIGQTTFLHLLMLETTPAPVIPLSAVVDDAGRPIAFIQVEGESFERRPLTLGARDGTFVQVVSGVKAGERVVTRGAYLVRLAALSTQVPAHGHVH